MFMLKYNDFLQSDILLKFHQWKKVKILNTERKIFRHYILKWLYKRYLQYIYYQYSLL